MFILIISLFFIVIILNPAQVIGNGSFGVVYQARLIDSQEMVAIKKVLQDKRFKVRLQDANVSVYYFFMSFFYFKALNELFIYMLTFSECCGVFRVRQNRELQIMRKLDHCNIVRLRYFFYSSGEKVQPFFPLRFQQNQYHPKKYFWEHFFHTAVFEAVRLFGVTATEALWLDVGIE